jgi:hypothetical protein
MSPCQHKRGEEHNGDYRHCLDCGREWTRIGSDWFEVEAWIQVDKKFLTEQESGR